MQNDWNSCAPIARLWLQFPSKSCGNIVSVYVSNLGEPISPWFGGKYHQLFSTSTPAPSPILSGRKPRGLFPFTVTRMKQQGSQTTLLPISGVYPRGLPSVVIDKEHPAVVIPGFLPASGQRQLRALPAFTAAYPRHSVGTPCPFRKSWASEHYKLFVCAYSHKKQVNPQSFAAETTAFATHPLSRGRKKLSLHSFYAPRSSMFASSTIFHSVESIFGHS